MQYIITKTSLWNDECPHPKAKQVTVKKYKDIRTFKDKEEWLTRFPKDAEGVLEWGVTKDEHPYRIIDGSHIKLWIIEIKDLRAFVKEVGEIILSLSRGEYPEYDGLMCIEIYDDYRE